MQVFISWSGERSKATAEILADWIQNVIQAVEPWISVEIEKGARWGSEISQRLEGSKVGIFCLTSDNLNSKWLHFEAGAIAKVKEAKVCTFLLDIKPSNVEPPLSQFQSTIFEKEEIRKLARTINSEVQKSAEKSLSDKKLDEIFDLYWANLSRDLTEIKEKQAISEIRLRTPEDILAEILDVVRGGRLGSALKTQIYKVRFDLAHLPSQLRVLCRGLLQSPQLNPHRRTTLNPIGSAASSNVGPLRARKLQTQL